MRTDQLSHLRDHQINALVEELKLALWCVDSEPATFRAVEAVIDLLVDYRDKRNGVACEEYRRSHLD
jgi:hypothetical protein